MMNGGGGANATSTTKKVRKKIVCKQGGCATLARRLGYCIKHGGGKCKYPSCSAVAKYKGGVCKKHIQTPTSALLETRRGRPLSSMKKHAAPVEAPHEHRQGGHRHHGATMAGGGATQPHSQHAPPPPFPTPGATARAAARSRALVPLPATVSDFLPGAGAGAGAAILQAGATAGLGAGSSMAHSRGSRRKQASSSRPTRHVTGTAHPGLPAVYGYINTNANTFSAAAAPHSHVHMQLAHNEMSVDLDWIDNGASVGSATAAAAAASGAGRCDDTFRGGDDDYTIAEEHEGEGSAVQSAPAAAAAAAAPTSVASTPLQPPTNPRTPISTAVEDVLGVSVTLPPDTEAILAQVLGAMVGTLLAKGTAAAAAAAATAQESNPLWACLHTPRDALRSAPRGPCVLAPEHVAATCSELGLDVIDYANDAGGGGSSSGGGGAKTSIRACFVAGSSST